MTLIIPRSSFFAVNSSRKNGKGKKMETMHQDGNNSESVTDRFGSVARNTAEKAKNFLTPQDGVVPGERPEGTLTAQLESITSKVPSGTFLSSAFGVMGLSALLHISGRKKDAAFIGQWVPAILIMGLYNKLVKLEGSSGSNSL